MKDNLSFSILNISFLFHEKPEPRKNKLTYTHSCGLLVYPNHKLVIILLVCVAKNLAIDNRRTNW